MEGLILRVKRDGSYDMTRNHPGLSWEFIHPELQKCGPDEIDLIKLRSWFHPDQIKKSGGRAKRNSLKGSILHQKLVDTGIIRSCLSLHDGEALLRHNLFDRMKSEKEKKDGLEWCGLHLFLWKSVAHLHPHLQEQSCLAVPVVKRVRDGEGEFDFADEPGIYWHDLSHMVLDPVVLLPEWKVFLCNPTT